MFYLSTMTKDEKKAFGARLKYFREVHLDRGQEDFAKMISAQTTQANVSSWETGTFPDGPNLELIWKAFPELNKSWMLWGKEDMLNKPVDPLPVNSDGPDTLSRLLSFLERTEQRIDRLLNSNELAIKNNEKVASALIEMSTALIGKIKQL